jgi:DNA-binding beta-propeller fold protein YncE
MKFRSKIFKGLLFISLIALVSVSSIASAKRSVVLKVFPPEYRLTANGVHVPTANVSAFLKRASLSTGVNNLIFTAEGYHDLKVKENITAGTSQLEYKLERKSSLLEQVAVIQTGPHPKSVEFTPDGKYMVSALLEGTGVDLFSVKDLKKIKTIEFPENYARRRNFVEIVFLPEKNEMWVSQMAANAVHVIDMKDYTYKLTIDTKGVWTKVMCFTPDKKLAFASNWESRDISIIDTARHEVLGKIKVSGVPRGMIVSNDGKYLYTCVFENGQMQKIDIEKRRVEKTITFQGRGAKRHIVMDREKGIFYITDMFRGTVFVMSAKDDSIIKEIKVDQKLNTCKLTPDKKYLFVSSRGPNNPETYLKKGPKFGKIYVIDTETLEIVDWVWGKNQPTGLDISPDGKYLAFTNFLDREIEVYRINSK